jgi:chemotaxis methyl-accepting protein methylase
MTDWTPAALERLEAILRQRSGLTFGEARAPFLRNRAREAMARACFISIPRWLAEVSRSAEKRGTLYCDLEESLQVQETAFFRYEVHHRALRDTVLPPLLKRGGLRARVASIGCATGEEAYSLAMTVRECGPRATEMVEIVGLDVSRSALTQAVAGTYPRGRLESVSPEYQARYFMPAGSDRVTVIPALRRMVRFRHHDIRRGFYLGKFDVIVCCDVLPAFTPAMQTQVLGDLADSLADGGYLFLGPAEGVAMPGWAFDTDDALAPFAYRRAGGGPAIAAPSHG